MLFCAWWVLQILVVANGRYLGMRLWGESVSWGEASKSATFSYGAWAVISILAFLLVQRFPFSRECLGRNLLIHVGAAVCFVFVKVGSSALVAPHVEWLTEISWRDRLIYEAPNHALYYLLLLGAALGIVYYRRARDDDVLASRLEAQLARAELLLLRAQLNPHFLFNTLNAIAELMHRDVEQADRMVARLGELLREALRPDQAQLIPLAEELAFLRAYLEIEDVRFGDRLCISWNIDPGIRNALVPSFVLQPLVENAIRHGLAPRRVEGLLEIRANAADGNLHLQVRDNGVGLRASVETRGMGVGLANTRERLEKLYGRLHTFAIVSRPEGGVCVLLILPLRFKHPEKAGVLALEM